MPPSIEQEETSLRNVLLISAVALLLIFSAVNAGLLPALMCTGCNS